MTEVKLDRVNIIINGNKPVKHSNKPGYSVKL